jgi:hypothetical protein
MIKWVYLISLFCFLSCDPCRSLDCASSNYYGQFRIVSSTTNKDLVFGPNKVYNKDQINFYSLSGIDTTFFPYQAIYFPGPGYDSILYVNFFPAQDTAFMRLSNGDTDTLQLTYQAKTTKCCGTITEISNFRINNTINIPGTQGTQLIKK